MATQAHPTVCVLPLAPGAPLRGNELENCEARRQDLRAAFSPSPAWKPTALLRALMGPDLSVLSSG